MQELTPEQELQEAHRAARQVLHAMRRWNGSDRLALIVVLLTALNAIDHPENESFVEHAREVIFDILGAFPGLIERVPID
jgi:di/tricarboxylate transporter